MRGAAAHVAFGIDNPVRAQLLEHAAVHFILRFSDDHGNAHLLEQHGNDAAGFQVGTDGDDGNVEIGDAQLSERLCIGGVSLNGMRDAALNGVHQIGIDIYGQNVRAVFIELFCDAAAEQAQAQYDKLSVFHVNLLFGGQPIMICASG